MPRRLIALGVLALLGAAACTGGTAGAPGGAPGVTPGSPAEGAGQEGPGGPELEAGSPAAVACGLPRSWLRRIVHGYYPGRSGELQILPRKPNFVGAGLPHVGPWAFVQRVPLFWYGPGYIKPLGAVKRPVTLADIAPTQARLLGFDFAAPDGEPLTEALVPAADRPDPPRLIVTIVWDAAGQNVLAEWPDAWPTLRGLRAGGAWYENATVGTSPSSTAQVHATIGTGAFPAHHGLVGHHFRSGSRIISPWKGEDSPDLLLDPTLADLYDAAMGNRPVVGLSATVGIHLGMVGHGARWEGGDRDVVVLREPGNATTLGAEGVAWNLPEHLRPWYRFPSYANDVPPLSSYFDEVDPVDGSADGTWRGHAFTDPELLGGFHTPARIPYQTRLIEEMIEREGFGRDRVPDLLSINYKLIDEIGHRFTMNSEEMRDTLRVQDEYLGRLIDFLDRRVGRGRWVLAVTADHGSTPDPRVSGAFQISAEKLHAAIRDAFDRDGDDVSVIDQVKQTEIFMNEEELAEQGFTLREVADFVMGLSQRDLFIPELGEPPRPGARVFQAAFPSEVLADLPCLRG